MKAATKIFLLLFLLLPWFSKPVYSISKAKGSLHIQVRKPSADKLNQYKGDKNFNYEENKHEHHTFWERFLRWLGERMTPKGLKGNYGSANMFWVIIELLIVGAAVSLFIYFLLKSQGVSLFSKNSGGSLNLTESHEDISQMNFDELIAKAASGGQYRQAVRYLYLKSLKQLSDLDLIKWKADKTNLDYTIEMRHSPFSKVFSEITLLFDYAWYGNASINEGTFVRIKNSFDNFNNQAGQKT